MTAKVIRIPEFREREASKSAEPMQAEAQATGWDPYEVWRTRVLQPRLEEESPEQVAQHRPRWRSFFAKLRRSKTD